MLQCPLYFPGVQCPHPGSLAHGRVTPTLNEYLYRDYIFVRCDTGYKLMMVRWKSPFCRQMWHTSVNPVFLLGWGRAAELLRYVPKQRAVAPPSARVPQYDCLNLPVTATFYWPSYFSFSVALSFCSNWLRRTQDFAQRRVWICVWFPKPVPVCNQVSLQPTVLRPPQWNWRWDFYIFFSILIKVHFWISVLYLPAPQLVSPVTLTEVGDPLVTWSLLQHVSQVSLQQIYYLSKQGLDFSVNHQCLRST